MYTISVQTHYDAAHLLRDYEGKCARLHGHRYVVEVALQAAEVGSTGMAYDFGDLKGQLKELAGRLDHQNLNEIPPFTKIESTAKKSVKPTSIANIWLLLRPDRVGKASATSPTSARRISSNQ